ncbi:MAG: O-antigen ligase family protein [Phycisphaerales bacterium]|nr:O-antigen ligase family protein [Phycisphaerales bacterium]
MLRDGRTAAADGGRVDMRRWVGLALVLVPWLVRATSGATSVPGWDLDPTAYWLDSPAIGPAGSMLLDAVAVIGAALLLWTERGVRAWAVGLAVIGTMACAAHAWLLPSADCAAVRGSLGAQRIGAAWVSAIWGAVAIGHAARDERVRRAGLGVLLGFVALLAARGAQEVLIDHAETVRAFNADPKRYIESRGWTLESSMARQFIRRLSQVEASGWFGLSNVYASFGVFGLVVSVGLVVAAVRAKRALGIAGAGVPGVLSAGVLYWADSKGGVAFAGLGLGLLVAGWVLSRRETGGAIESRGGRRKTRGVVSPFRGSKESAPRTGGLRPRLTLLRRCAAGMIGPACIGIVLMAIGVRGVIGERIGELSVLFRAFYIEAAVRIFGRAPIAGVGPDGFQQAYLTAKNPLSPEEVSSPHSILFDWLATLGIAGVAWGVLLMVGAALAGRALLRETDEGWRSNETSHGPESRATGASHGPEARATNTKAAMLILALATLGAAWAQSPLIPMEVAAVRVSGLAFGCLVAFLVVNGEWDGVWVRRGLAAGALAVMAHAQIEVTLSFAASCGLAMAACALGVGAGWSGEKEERGWRRSAGQQGAAFVVAVGALWGLGGAWPAWKWEQALRAGAGEARVVAEFADRLALVGAGKPNAMHPRDDMGKIVSDLGRELGAPVAQNQEGLERALIALDRKRLSAAAVRLEEAMRMKPGEWRVAREASRLRLRLASTYLHQRDSRGADVEAERAERVMTPPDMGDASAAWLRALALVQESYGRERDDAAWLKRGYETLEQAASKDPYNLEVAMRLFRVARLRGDGPSMKRWAQRALDLDQLARLDKDARGLSTSDRAELEAAGR